MSNIAICPGSFDPITFGHIDVIRRASRIFDKLIIGVLVNSNKSPLFSIEDRVNMIKTAVKDLDNVEVRSFSGLTVEFAAECGAGTIVRGMRTVTDFEYEITIAETNRGLNPEVDTVFLATSLEYTYLSSTIVKEVALYGGDISKFVPEEVADLIKKKMHTDQK